MNSIFDEAGKSAKGKPKPSASAKSITSSSHKTSTHTKYSQADAETAGMLQRIKEMKHDLDLRIEEVYTRAKSSNIDANLLMQSMSHQFAEEIEKLKAAEKKLLDQFGKNPTPSSAPQVKSSEKLTQERKGKTRGMRKWIPM